jgi:hypothetical protein
MSSLWCFPKGQCCQSACRNAGKACTGEALIVPNAARINVMKFLDTYLMNEFQQSSIICTYLIDTMTVVGHDERASEAQEHLQRTVNDSNLRCVC